MVGSGIFLLPASLAIYGGIGMIGWVCAALGALLLAYTFGALSKIENQSIGGPYVYTRLSFGDFPAFLVAWGYWISIWTTNAAIAVALVGYLTVFLPVLGSQMIYSILTGLGFLWFFTWINTRSLDKIASVQVLTTILKIIPIFLVGIFGLFYINWDNFIPFNISGQSDFAAITATTTLTLFAFQGMESAGIMSGETDNAAEIVKKATFTGTLVTIFIYLCSSFAIMGILSPDILARSSAPFADASYVFWGTSSKYIVAGGAVISTMGALNGWILLQGRIPMAAANDHLFPGFFGKINKNRAPAFGIIASSVLASVLMALNFSKSLVEAFTFMMVLATLAVLVPYIFSSLSLAKFSMKKEQGRFSSKLILPILTFLFCIWVVIGCGREVILFGLLLFLLSVPVYFMIRKSQS